MKTDIPPPIRLSEMTPAEQRQIRKVHDRLEFLIQMAIADNVPTGLVANCMLSEAARIIACLDYEGRHKAVRVLRANIEEMVENYARQIRQERGLKDG